MPALVVGIHVLLHQPYRRRGWPDMRGHDDGVDHRSTPLVSRRPAHFVRKRTIGQRFGEMDAADLFRAVEVGERSCHPQHAVIAAGGEPHGVGRIAQQRKSARVRPRDILEHRAVRGGVGADVRQPDCSVALDLDRAGARDAGSGYLNGL